MDEKMDLLVEYEMNLTTASTLTIIGVAGNAAIIIVILRSKLLENSFFRYMIAASIFDILNVLLLWMSPVYEILNINRFSLNCKLNIYFNMLVSHLCPWMNVLSSIDRYLSVKYATKFEIRKKFKYQFLAILFVCLIIGLIDTPFIFFVNVTTNGTLGSGCSTINNHLAFLMAVLEALMSFTLPCILMILSACVIGYELIILKKRTMNKKDFVKEKRMLKTLLSMNLFFFVTYSPYSFMLLAYSVLNKNYFGTLAYYIVRVLYRVYSASTIFVFLASNILFRQNFISMINCFKKK